MPAAAASTPTTKAAVPHGPGRRGPHRAEGEQRRHRQSDRRPRAEGLCRSQGIAPIYRPISRRASSTRIAGHASAQRQPAHSATSGVQRRTDERRQQPDEREEAEDPRPLVLVVERADRAHADAPEQAGGDPAHDGAGEDPGHGGGEDGERGARDVRAASPRTARCPGGTGRADVARAPASPPPRCSPPPASPRTGRSRRGRLPPAEGSCCTRCPASPRRTRRAGGRGGRTRAARRSTTDRGTRRPAALPDAVPRASTLAM